MITIYTNLESYQYDLYALTGAFYPEHELRVCSFPQDAGNEADTQSYIIEVRFLPQETDAVFCIGEKRHFNIKTDTDVTKTRQKLLYYQMLCEYTGRTLPWGGLTGVRPAKLAMAMLQQGMSDGETAAAMKERYGVSDEKARLAADIAGRERRILGKINKDDSYSLYIGIPFCPTKCLYCSFTSYPAALWKNRMDEYLQALFCEIDYVAEAFKGKSPDTVYIGGGTPTTLEARQLDRLLSYLHEKLDLSGTLELTVEAGRADSITRDKLRALKRNGVTRISVNPQTMNEETLKVIGRQHTPGQVREAYFLAREAGFDNINMDIILGLPNEREQEVQRTINEIEELNPDSLTVHSLAIKRASRLSSMIKENGIAMLKNTDSTMAIARQGAERLGMKPYYLYRQKNMSGNFENVGYAREGKYGIYNILIMEEVQTIVALGAGSISKRVYPDRDSRHCIERCENVKDVALYIEKIDEMVERKRGLFGEV
ncbi:MAG: coproporphyrinogen dehydrogenase HemZ [Lachnospiraceae bacterium]|nr:coproporphyrinogen dehydrogenase HemZ [Lachnospiraceae bacterium]